jgi:mannose-6-phosphate isomerase-like protein (cupin superfamily)
MAGYTTKRIDDMEAAFGGAFKRARAELGVESFGMQVLDLPPNLENFPEHDHAETGQEEVYLVLRGAGELDVDGERVPLEPETIVRVAPDARRKFYTRDKALRVLALGGVPGGVYEAPAITKLGGPDPAAQSN